MGKDKKVIEYLESVIDTVTAAVFFLLFALGAYALLDTHMVNKSAEVDEEVTALAPSDDESAVDFSELKAINPEIVGWIKINDTNINYPIMQTTDNSKYLVHNYRDEYSTSGGIFVDTRNNEFSDDFTIIYGHRMDGSLMFGSIADFSDQEFFNNHQAGVLYTSTDTYDLQITSYAVLNIENTNIYKLGLNSNGRNPEVLQEIIQNSRQFNSSSQNDENKFILLSTCDADSRHYRDVLLFSATKR